jgi:hypothetical protein
MIRIGTGRRNVEERALFADAGTKQLQVAESARTIGGVESLAANVERLKSGSRMKTAS